MRRTQDKDSFAGGVQWATQQSLKMIDTAPHMPLVSMHLYAHAAAGPEYEYPACL